MSNAKGKSDVPPTESKTTRTVGNFPRGSREIPAVSDSFKETDRSEKARCRTADMHVAGKSDDSIVPEKRANKAGPMAAAESVEGRESTEGNVAQIGHDTDTVPKRREDRSVRRTRGTCFRVTPEVGAVCGNSARTDLCGGVG